MKIKRPKPKFKVGQVVCELEFDTKSRSYRGFVYGRINLVFWDNNGGDKKGEGGWMVAGNCLTTTHESYFSPLTERERG